MIRTPLRPLARILDARGKGENPDAIERENMHRRHEEMRGQARVQAEGRLLILGATFLLVFILVGGRMALIAGSEPSEPRASAAGASIRAQRADILDRRGRILATNMETYSLYAQPPQMIDPGHAADRLAAIFPDLEREALIKKFTGKRKFLWIKRKISPEQRQAVHDIGDPGLLFGPREMRLYPNGALASHVLGGARFGREGVHAAEVVGVAGIEKKLDSMMRDPARGGEPVRLSLDLTVQAAVERVLSGGMTLMNAKGASAVVMDVQTGELLSVASLPDFDPNDRPGLSDGADSPLFNRAVQGVYELGSTFKIFAVVQAMDLGLITPESMIDTKGPLKWGKFLIRDFHDYGAEMTTSEVIVKSSNIGAARIAQQIGVERQQAFLRDLGLLDPVPLEIIEAGGSQPLLPHRWSELSAMTISYGHGMSVTPLHLATAYSIIANGGRQVRPTLLPHQGQPSGKRVMSRESAAAARRMLRRVVTEGTASFGEVSGYSVGGKTGTADKPNPQGGYYEDKTITTFASMFPADKPKYVLVVMLDEPVETTGPEPRRTAGWTAVPVAAEIIRRIAPLLGVRPEIEPAPLADITLTSSN